MTYIDYLDNQRCVVNISSNNHLNDSVLSYIKRSSIGFDKMFDLKLPQHPSTSSSSESSKSIESLDEDWIHEPSVINWADEVCKSDPIHVEVPEWARIAGLDYEVDNENFFELTSERQIEYDYNQNNFVGTLADDEPAIILELPHIPGFVTSVFKKSVKEFTFNWADEVVALEQVKNVEVPEWATIPGFDFQPESDNKMFLSSIEESSFSHVVNWADDTTGLDGDVQVPEWALIPGVDYHIITSLNTTHSVPINWSSGV